jgi:hypothetical protein
MGLVVSSLEGNRWQIVHGKVCIVTAFTSHHGIGSKTVRADTGVVPTSILVATIPVGGSR